MTFISIFLVLVWVGVVIFWPSYNVTGNLTSKPAMVLASAIIIGALIVFI